MLDRFGEWLIDWLENRASNKARKRFMLTLCIVMYPYFWVTQRKYGIKTLPGALKAISEDCKEEAKSRSKLHRALK